MESGRHQELWRQLHREIIWGLEEELELLRLRQADLQQSAQEREVALLELLSVERARRLAAGTGAATAGAPDEEHGPANPARPAAASARAAELLARLSLTDPRLPELESALRARDKELAEMRNRKAFRAIAAVVGLKRRLLGRGWARGVTP